MKNIFSLISFFISVNLSIADDSQSFLKKGWGELAKDNDTVALKYFGMAYEKAKIENNTEAIATSLLNMGICFYGVSYNDGLEYCFKAMNEFKKLEKNSPLKALQGRSKCLQLISTIKSRQGKYKETISLSKQAMLGFPAKNDTTGTLGLIYNSLGIAYENLNLLDSSEYFHRLALKERLTTNFFIYLPGSYVSVAAIELKHLNKELSHLYYSRALAISDSTDNRQAQVLALLGNAKWLLTFERNKKEAENNFLKAKEIAQKLSDKYFYLQTLEQLSEEKKKQGNFKDALKYTQEIQIIKDTLADWEKQRILKSLEVKFDLSEKDRQLNLAQKEKDIVLLTNYLLWISIVFLIMISIVIIFLLNRINKRNKLVLQTKEALVKAIEEHKKIKEEQMQNEIEFKESQLTAMTLQILQKNELLQELKEKLEADGEKVKDKVISKIINKAQNHDKEWNDFNSYFESINKNFYSKLKLAYPEISPNDLKICALIKLNLSIKEMAGILNISPDSVKTARYRLRKKLQLNTEDNLTDFILNLK